MATSSLLCAAVVFLCIVSSCQADIREEDDVLVLTSNNFDEAIANNKLLLVEFYAPWCGHCKALTPEYAAAAGTLREEQSEIRLAKVDATEETSLGEKFDVQGFPTIKFFRNGKPIEYTGGRTSTEIVAWLKKKTGPPATAIDNKDTAEEFITNDEVVVVGYFAEQTSDDAKAFLEAAAEIDSIPFGISSSKEVADHVELKGEGVVLLKKFDERRNVFEGKLTAKALAEFVQANSLPLVIEFSDETAQQIFGGGYKKQLLVFAGKDADSYEGYVESMKKVAAEFRGKILFVTVNTDYDDNERIMEFFHIKSDDLPTMRIVHLADDQMRKYVPEKADMSEENIRAFATGVVDGKTKPHLSSEDVPVDWDAEPVKIVVGKNFQDVVIDNKKNVFIEFYAPWCGHCKQLAPIWDKVAKYFDDRSDVIVAKMDATANEVEGLQVSSYPTIMMYPAGDKATPIEYQGARSYDAIVRFIESGGRSGADPPSDDEEESDEIEGLDDDEEGMPEDSEEASDLEETPEERELQAQAEEELRRAEEEAKQKDEL